MNRWTVTASPVGWDALTAAQSPIADAAFIRCFADAFGEPAAIHTLHEDERVIAALPAVRAGRLVRTWTSLDNEHHPYWLVSGALDTDRATHLLEHLLDRAECVTLRRLPVADPACEALVGAARRLHLPVVQLDHSGDARIALVPGWQPPNNFRRDLPRKQRNLERLGDLQLVEHTTPGAALDAALVECFDVETRGWKGARGSPINRDPHTLRFYSELAPALAAAGRFVLYALVLDGRVIAFEYCLRGGGHLEMLKLSFDPAYAAHSPGQVLRLMLLRRELERGKLRFYHLGRPSRWKLRWATEVAPLCTLRIYARTPRARAAHLLGPALRARVKTLPWMMRLVARLRR